MFELEDHYRAIQDEAAEVAQRVAPFAAEADRRSDLHDGIRDALADSNLGTLVVPGAFGGRFDTVDPLAVCLAREQLMPVSAQLDSLFALQGIGSYALAVAGSPSLQEQWLPKVARLDAIAALALTEERAGSDAKALETTVTVDGDELVVSGEKTFISNGGIADFYTVVASEGDGFATVLVPADAPGVSTTPTPPIIAPHVLGTVHLDEVRVPADHRLGDPGRGFGPVFSTLAVFRISVAGAAVGIAQAALDEMVEHASKREQFGKPLAQIGAVAQMIAQSWEDVETSRLATYRAAWLAGRDGAKALGHSSMAKVVATEAAARVVDRGVQVMGRWGLVQDSKMERLYRASRPMRIYEGATEVLRDSSARALVKQFAAKEGSS